MTKHSQMKPKIFVNVILLSLLVISSLSCNKYLDLQPQDGIIRQEFWKTKEQVQSAVIGCYASLLSDPANKERPVSEYLFTWGELRADMVGSAIGASSDDLDIFNVNTLSTNTDVNWVSIYKTINYCNTVIDFAPGVLVNDNTFTQQQLNQYLAEARALRGLMYFYLVRSFRDVPLKLTSTSSDVDLVQLPKTSSDTILTQIVADLAFADSNAVFTYGNATTIDKGRITKYTVKSIQADVFLWMDRYSDALDACQFVIDSKKFGLIAGNGGWFNNLYYMGNSNEGIFEFQYDQQKLNSFYPIFTTSRARFVAEPVVMDQIYGVDYINDLNKDIRGDGASVRTSDNTIWKYVALDYNSFRGAEASYAHWFVYRYADILLMKAEALIQIGGAVNTQTAKDLIYDIRKRAKAIVLTDSKPDIADKGAMTDFLLQERAREFSFEGKRWYDLLRNAKRNNYERLDILLDMVSRTVPANRQQSAINKYKDAAHNSHYFPIYFYEIQADPNLIQNPFYK